MDSNPALCKIIRSRISSSPQRRITFAEYMDMALYHPEYGYYSTKAVNLGKRGDFFTSVHLGADFGELLAEQFFQMWEILGRPKPFTLLEMGAGQGLLAADILNYLQRQYLDFFLSLEYVIVEKSLALRQEQQQRLQDFPLRWCNLEDIPPLSITGCFFSNELVDAFPVHQFILEAGELREIYVTTREEWGRQGDKETRRQGDKETRRQGDKEEFLRIPPSPEPLNPFVEVIGEVSSLKIAEYFDLLGIDFAQSAYPDGYRSEINLAAVDWLSIVADRLKRGYLLTIDYGYPANRYYNPRRFSFGDATRFSFGDATRTQGTLQCYYQHRHHDNPYINIGRQDITAHVDFTALEKSGDRSGLQKVGFTQQGLFLMALGLGSRIANLSHQQQPISQMLQRRDALHQLLDPMGLGGFGVLVQSKGLKEAEISQPLKGLFTGD
ncbi:class I SAM-dependent methyltransferase [Scytonema hofmannii FACHB-248]|uniref:Class I SAM-dependent methyltransferase n=1 Tax=Scytonema hofmannii FACHB-248 TaxID=1842502 RepID=A0ABR8H1K1_9CYAN|nr:MULTISPECIES: class I SAM-dependent methyltransferase [Nostocales]MBD2609339.1 class I SAM-dependent methyltransferase [Scytonema hofmannii FACHB-248]